MLNGAQHSTRSEHKNTQQILRSSLHDNLEAARDTSFVNHAFEMWESYRTRAMKILGVRGALLKHIRTIYYSNLILKTRDQLPTKAIIITDTSLFIVKIGEMRKIRTMIPFSAVNHLVVTLETYQEDIPPFSHITIVSNSRNGEEPIKFSFFMSQGHSNTFIDIFERIYTDVTAHLLPIIYEPGESAEKRNPLSTYNEHLRAEEEVRSRILFTFLKYKTTTLVTTLSNVSIMKPNNNIQWGFVAKMLLTICKRMGILRELLKSCLKFEILRAKDPLRNHNASFGYFFKTGGFLRTNSLAMKVIELFTANSACKYARLNLGETLKVIINAVQNNLFNAIETVRWSEYVFAPIFEKNKVPFPNEAFTLTHLILEIEENSSNIAKSFIGDMFFILYLGRGVRDPSQLGLANDGLSLTRKKNLNRIASITERVFNGAEKLLNGNYLFAPSICVDSDESAIRLLLGDKKVRSYQSNISEEVSQCVNTLIESKEVWDNSSSEVNSLLEKSILEEKRTELAALNDAIGKYSIHLIADISGDLWDLVMLECRHEICPVPLKRFEIPDMNPPMVEINCVEVERIKRENAQLQMQMHELRSYTNIYRKRESEAVDALEKCQKRLDEQNQEIQMLRMQSIDSRLKIPPLPISEKNNPFLDFELNNFSPSSKSQILLYNSDL